MNNPIFVKNEYARTADSIALGLLFHGCLLQLRPDISHSLMRLFAKTGMGEGSAGYTNVLYAINIILYSAAFLLPSFFIFRYTKTVNTACADSTDFRHHPVTDTKSVGFSLKFPKHFYILLPAAVGCIAIAGRLTEFAVKLFEKAGIGFTSFAPEIPDDLVGLILVFVYSAVVPSVVEEILFRKVILSKLSPYGKNFAIILSSVLFALMHTNPTQMLYAFVGGYFMGYVALKCGSVIPSMIIHFTNNSLSLIYLIIQKYCVQKVFDAVAFTSDTVLSVIGLVVFAVMIAKKQLLLPEKKPLGFSPYKESLRLLLIFYTVSSIYLSLKWVYII